MKVSSVPICLLLIFAGIIISLMALSGCQSPEPARPIASAPEALTDRDIADRFDLTLDQVDRLHRMRGLSNAEIAALSPKMFKKALKKIKKPKAGYPGEYLTWRHRSLVNENGVIPHNALLKARHHVDRMPPPGNRRIWGHKPGIARSATLSTDDWEWLGPGNIGGRIRSAVIDPDEPERIWIGSVAGGIWVTENGGRTWSPVDDFMANLAVSTLVMDPFDTDILYAGTGEGFYNADGIRGAGIFKSVDRGVTWEQIDATTTEDWYYVNRLAFSPDSTALMAATRAGLFRSIDQGDSWEQVMADANLLDVKFDPTDAAKAIASGYDADLNGVVFYSEDGGLTWTASEGLTSEDDYLARTELAYAPSDPSIVYASKDLDYGTFYKSEDGGRTFSQVSTGYNYLGSQGWYNNTVWVDPFDPNLVILGGIDLYRSTDGGETFTKISVWYESPQSAHADHHCIVHHPDYNGYSNRTVFFLNDGGIYMAENVLTVEGSDGWQELNNNLGITQFYGAAGHPGTGVIIGGTQDNGSLSYSGDPENWTEFFGGDGGFCAIDPDDGNYCYGEYVYLNIHRNTLGGAANDAFYEDLISGQFYNFSAGAYEWKSEPYVIPDARDYDAEFIAPFILDPNDSNTMLAGGKSLWRTSDVKTENTDETGPSWTSIKDRIGDDYEHNITAIAVADRDSDIIWAGHGNGQVYRTGGGTADAPYWRQMGSGVLPERRCQRIVISPDDVETVYVTFGGYSAGNVYKTTDAGETWMDYSGSGDSALPEAPVRALAIHPQDTTLVYAGTEVGIFASDDGGETWSSTNQGPTNCSVDELFWLEDAVLVAATHGRGVFKINLNLQSVDLALSVPDDLDMTWGDTLGPVYYTLTSQSDDTTLVSVRLFVTLPGNEEIPVSHARRLIQPAETMTLDQTFDIPGRSPAGSYTFAVELLDENLETIDRDDFTFTVTLPGE